MAKRVRSLAKAVSYRILGSGTTVVVAYLVTGDVALSGAVGVGDLILKTAAYYVHERIWANIAWGRSYTYGTKETSCTDQPDHVLRRD